MREEPIFDFNRGTKADSISNLKLSYGALKKDGAWLEVWTMNYF